METQGFIKLSRKFVDWDLFTDVKTSQLFMYLLLSANCTPQKYQGIVIQRGQLLTRYSDIKEGTGLSVRTIRTCLKRLEKAGEITFESINKCAIITVCDFDKYCD